MNKAQRMQTYLLLIRRSLGWTAEKFGEEIGVTRQTINNLEKDRNKLSKTQYLAIRNVLNDEIVKSPDDTKMLVLLLEVLIDNPEAYTKEQREQIVEKANIMAPAILAGASSRQVVSDELATAILSIAPVVLTVAGATVTALLKLLKEK